MQRKSILHSYAPWLLRNLFYSHHFRRQRTPLPYRNLILLFINRVLNALSHLFTPRTMIHSTEFVTIRKHIFSRYFPVDTDLTRAVRHEAGHRFLYTPASQLCCQYLTAYITAIASHHFGRGIDNIHILDWGCGKGWVTYFLNKYGADVTCCDIVSGKNDSAFGQVTPIIDKFNLSVVPLNHTYELPFASKSFDIVLSVGVLEHVTNEKESLLEIGRILSDKGLFICFNLPYYFSWVQRALHIKGNFYHDRLYTEKRTRKLLEDAHFHINDLWHRQLYPRSILPFSWYYILEQIDQYIVERTPLKYVTNYIEFIAEKKGA